MYLLLWVEIGHFKNPNVLNNINEHQQTCTKTNVSFVIIIK